MAKRKAIDWEAIEREYRAGQLSNVQIGKEYDVSEGAIRKKAKADGWQKDLAKKVREAVREKLVRNEVRTPNANDRDIIEQSAERASRLILDHRKDIAALRSLETNLIDELQNNPTKLYLAQYQGQIIEKTVGLTASERAGAANNLANVQHKRIQLERQAFNLDDSVANLGDILSALPGEFREAVRAALTDAVS